MQITITDITNRAQIPAIKALRDATRGPEPHEVMSLRAAKDIIDAVCHGVPQRVIVRRLPDPSIIVFTPSAARAEDALRLVIALDSLQLARAASEELGRDDILDLLSNPA